MHRIFSVLLVALLLLPAAAATAQSTVNTPLASAAPEGAVTLRPGDVVRVSIWREEELSGEFPVDQNGTVTLPLLGDKQVSGVPLDRLREVLIEEYRVHLRNPSINIIPLRRVNILGEVQRPGLYAVDPTTSLAVAVAMAGGATGTGDLNRIRIIRGSDVIHERVGAGETLTAVDIRSGDQIFVDRRSWFERNSTFLITVALNVPAVVTGVIGLINLLR